MGWKYMTTWHTDLRAAEIFNAKLTLRYATREFIATRIENLGLILLEEINWDWGMQNLLHL